MRRSALKLGRALVVRESCDGWSRSVEDDGPQQSQFQCKVPCPGLMTLASHQGAVQYILTLHVRTRLHNHSILRWKSERLRRRSEVLIARWLRSSAVWLLSEKRRRRIMAWALSKRAGPRAGVAGPVSLSHIDKKPKLSGDVDAIQAVQAHTAGRP